VLTKLQEKQEALSDRLLELQKQKKEHEAKQVMEAFQKSGKSLQELMTVYSDQQTPFARSFRSSITEGEIHPHGS
jgi:thymidine phosphorylase